MQPHSRFRFSRNREKHSRSSALILALIFISLISVLTLGFLASIQTETFSAHSHLTGVQADVYADAGIDVAMSRLYSALSNPTNLWISEPGRIYTLVAGKALTPANATMYDLSSGAESLPDPYLATNAVDLNPQTLEGANFLLTDPDGLATIKASQMSGSSLYVRWIYQEQDGTLLPAFPATFNPANPIVGRFAFWVDDESTKINVNTAWARTNLTASGNPPSEGDPSRIGLDGLDVSAAAAIHSYATTNHFNSIREVGRAVSGLSAASTLTNQDQLSLSTYNHSPELNMFGEPRIMLTTQKKYADAANTTNFLDILNTENTDPGLQNSIKQSSLTTVVGILSKELTRSDWPFMQGQSFFGAAANGGKYNNQVTQMAINIIDYVRSAESTSPLVEPIRCAVGGTTLGGGNFIGNSRRPLLTEVALFIPAAPSVGATTSVPATYNITCMAKIYLPSDCPGAQADLTKISFGAYIYDYTRGPAGNVGASSEAAINPSTEVSNIHGNALNVLLPGGYATITRVVQYKVTTMAGSPASSSPDPLYANFSISSVNATVTSHRYQITPLFEFTKGSQGTSPGVNSWQLLSDPRVSSLASDWTAAASTFNSPPTVSILKNPVGTPQQDIDASGLVTDGVLLPAPAGTILNPNGVVGSVGEIGFIHAGMDNNTGTALPWRTVHLQPQSVIGVLPDWAMMDLFTVPTFPVSAAANAPYIYPNTNLALFVSSGGKININNTIYPLVDATDSPLIRPPPLTALLFGATNYMTTTNTITKTGTPPAANVIYTNTLATAVTLASNIVVGVPSAKGGVPYGTNIVSTGANLYFTPGAVTEVAGVADGSVTGSSGEGSEALVRELASTAATRGSVFSIYSVGQALKQNPKDGTLIVLGERRKRLITERVVTAGTTTSVVFRPVYSENIQP